MRAGLPGILLAAVLLAPAARAEAEFTVRSEVDSARIGTQDTLEFEIEVEGTGFRAVDPPDLTGLRDWDVLDGPRRVQRQSIVNGRFSAAVQLLWTLGPRRTGRLTIPSLPVQVDGERFRSDPVDVQVVKGSVASRVPATDRFGRPRRGAAVLLLAEVDTRRAYVGQQVTFTLRLLTQLGIRGMAYQTRAGFNGFWVEKEFDYIDDPPGRIEGTQVVHEGRPFNEYVLAKLALFPTSSGQLEIEPINLQLRVRAEGDGRFGSFFFDREKTEIRRSEPIRLQVLPLPEEGRPESFSGAVGDFRLEVETDRSESVVNDAVALNITVRGDGNIRSAGEPQLPALADFRRFEPTVKESHRFEEGRYGGDRTWEYVLVPLAPGEQSIPPIAFSYFDPRGARYRTLRSEPISLRIARGEGPELPRGTGLARREVTALGRDIHFIKLPSGGLEDRGAPFHRSGAYLTLLAMPLLLNAALLAWRVRADRLRVDVARRRLLGARRAFRAGLRAAEAARAAGDGPAFHAALAGALTGLLADRFNLAAAGLTRERIAGELRRSGAAGTVRREVEDILDACDAARFAGPAGGAAAAEELAARTAAVGRALEALR